MAVQTERFISLYALHEPSRIDALVDMVIEMNSELASKASNILVHCNTGSSSNSSVFSRRSQCGLFCSLFALHRQLIAYEQLDVVRIVRQLKSQRADMMIENLVNIIIII